VGEGGEDFSKEVEYFWRHRVFEKVRLSGLVWEKMM
jgi:hypothetical protein